MLRAVSRGAASPEEVAKAAGISLFLVRSGLREMAQGGFVAADGERCELTSKGQDAIAESA
jgi:predicted transcriptional regulator